MSQLFASIDAFRERYWYGLGWAGSAAKWLAIGWAAHYIARAILNCVPGGAS